MKTVLSAVLASLTCLLAFGAEEAKQEALPVFLEPGKTAADYRNVALNPNACTDEKPASYPHAASNSEYNKKEFAARCAIDGKTDNKDVHRCGSWGPQIQDDLWWKVDFGRPVEIDKAVIYIRAAFPHDNYWHAATFEFSDGSKEEIKIEKTAEPQTFPFAKRTVTWLKITSLKQSEPKKWCAFCEIQVFGKDAK
jgi:hypothetical protein